MNWKTPSRYCRYFKPAFDRVVALVLLIVLSPVLSFGVLLAAIASRGQPFFIHERPGFREKPFRLLKLRTMKGPLDADGRRLSNIERITPLGRLLRKTSIDEIPQLINVLAGEISLVGPRPLETWYLPHYSDRQRLRHSVLPGMTGLAQVRGRNSISWERKFELDIEYVESQSFMLDLKILLMTVVKIFKSSDVNAGETTTMDSFASVISPKNGDQSLALWVP